MTNDQSAWLAANPTYEPIGRTSGFAIWTQRGTLHPDGRFVRVTRKTPLSTGGGAFGVGVRGSRDPNQTPNPRDDASPRSPETGAAGVGGLQTGAKS